MIFIFIQLQCFRGPACSTSSLWSGVIEDMLWCALSQLF